MAGRSAQHDPIPWDKMLNIVMEELRPFVDKPHTDDSLRSYAAAFITGLKGKGIVIALDFPSIEILAGARSEANAPSSITLDQMLCIYRAAIKRSFPKDGALEKK